MWMNEYEVVETLGQTHFQVDEVPNMYAGARVLEALMEWTNSNSDGWPYWQKPAKAANSLMVAFHLRSYALRFGHDRDGSPLVDFTDEELAKALRPIKAFLTRQDVNWDADLPWAAILPATA